MTTLSPDSRGARLVDQLLDMLLVASLLGAPLIFYTKAYDVFEFNKITALRALCSLAGSLLLFKLLFIRPLKLTRTAMDVPVLAWLAVCLVATFHTVNWRLSLHGVYEDFEGITTWLMYTFMFWWPAQHVRSERQIRLVLGAVVLAGTVAGFYGLLQNFGIDFVPWNPDTYNPERMFSTMGNPNFLAAYTVMSMPITLALFLDLPDKIRTDKGFCALLVILGIVASAGLALLFNVNYFDLSPASFGAGSFFGMLISLKFWTTKILLAFPVICGVMIFYGRLRWILLLSLIGQLVSTLFTKSRGGVFSMAALGLLFGGAAAWELGGWRALLGLFGLLGAVVVAFSTNLWLPIYQFAFTEQRLAAFGLFVALLLGVRYLVRRNGAQGVLFRSLDYLLLLAVLVWAFLWVPQVQKTTFEMLERVSKLFHPSEVKTTPRLYIWKSALAMLHDNPWFGKGLDTFQISFPPYREAIYWNLEWNGTPEKAHNFIMQTAATMGGLGLLAFFWMHVAWVVSSFRDWRRQIDERRRMLLLAVFGAWLGFFVQNVFSFTVVGYGTLWWVLWGFLPAMQRTWEEEDGTAPIALEGAPAGWSSPEVAWKFGLAFLSLVLLAALLVGPGFSLGGPSIFKTALDAYNVVQPHQEPSLLVVLLNALSSWPLRLAGTLAGLGALGLLLLGNSRARNPLAARVLFVAASVGAFYFSWHSVRSWVADSFYKQGQVGMNVGQPGYAVAMYKKAAGDLEPISEAQLNSIHLAMTPTAAADRLRIKPGLNPDQELYWVKMGIAYENAAGTAPKQEDKLIYNRYALAIHQYTLEMNPINGYNYNNKGRVLKTMGEATGQAGYYERALEHYDKAIALDVNNVYFNLDKANTLLNLGRSAESLEVVLSLIKKFPDFAMPYSYAGFIKMRAGQKAEAISWFEKAVAADWKRDSSSRGLAAANLGLLYATEKKPAQAEAAFRMAISSNPGLAEAYLNLSDLQLKNGRKAESVDTLQALLRVAPNQPQALAALKRLGVTVSPSPEAPR